MANKKTEIVGPNHFLQNEEYPNRPHLVIRQGVAERYSCLFHVEAAN